MDLAEIVRVSLKMNSTLGIELNATKWNNGHEKNEDAHSASSSHEDLHT
jgi:hypothetical protein